MSQLDSHKYYAHVEKAHKNQSFSPLYFFYGNEPYLIDQAVQYLKTFALHGSPLEFTFSLHYGDQFDVSAFTDEAQSFPLLCTRKIMYIKDIQHLKDKDWNFLEPLLSETSTSTILILTGNKLDKRKKYFRILSTTGIAVEFKKPSSSQIPGWIQHLGKARGLSLTEEAIQMMQERAGDILSDLDTEMQKLQNYMGENKHVQVTDVMECVTKKREENVFDLMDSIADNKPSEALLRLTHLIDQGQNEIGIVALLSRHMRILMRIKKGIHQGLMGPKLAEFAEVPSYFLNNYVRQSRNWSQKNLNRTILLLSDTDRALKFSPLSSHLWLENLILKTCVSNRKSQ